MTEQKTLDLFGSSTEIMSINQANATAPRGYKCPVCGEHMKVRVTQPMSPTVKYTLYQCTNPVCGASFRGTTSLDAIISPSAMPHDLNLPRANPAKPMKPEEDHL